MNFKAWLIESEFGLIPDDKKITEKTCFDILKDAIQVRNTTDINAATLIDSSVGIKTMPFLYFESTDEFSIGGFGQYHRNIIEDAMDEDEEKSRRYKLLYSGVYGDHAPNGCVGRLAYGINFNNLKEFLSRDLLRDYNQSDLEELSRQFRKIDVIAYYKSRAGSKNEINVKNSLKKLEEAGAIKNKDKTIVINEKDVYVLGHMKEEEPKIVSPDSSVKPQSITRQQSREYSRKFGPKPQTMSQASYMYGIPMGDWNINK